MIDASPGPPGLGKFGSTYPAYSAVGGPDIFGTFSISSQKPIDMSRDGRVPRALAEERSCALYNTPSTRIRYAPSDIWKPLQRERPSMSFIAYLILGE